MPLTPEQADLLSDMVVNGDAHLYSLSYQGGVPMMVVVVGPEFLDLGGGSLWYFEAIADFLEVAQSVLDDEVIVMGG